MISSSFGTQYKIDKIENKIKIVCDKDSCTGALWV